MRKYASLFFLAAILALAACDSITRTELRMGDSPLEDFSFDGVPTLTFHGDKDKDIALKVRSVFMARSPDCQGMYILDEKSDQGFQEHSTGSPDANPPGMADVAGQYHKVQYLLERADAYSVETPLQLRHPQCDWWLAETSVHIGNDFTLGKGERSPKGEGLLALIHLNYVRRDYYNKNKMYAKYTDPVWESFPQTIKMRLLNYFSETGDEFMEQNFAGQGKRSNIPFMPNDILDKSVSIKMDLQVEGTVDKRKGEALPDWAELEKTARQ